MSIRPPRPTGAALPAVRSQPYRERLQRLLEEADVVVPGADADGVVANVSPA